MNKLKALIPIAISFLISFLCIFYLANQYHWKLKVTSLTNENPIEYATLQYKYALSILGTMISFVGIIAIAGFTAYLITKRERE